MTGDLNEFEKNFREKTIIFNVNVLPDSKIRLNISRRDNFRSGVFR